MNIVVAQSGGPTCAINSSLLGVIRESYETDRIKTVYGSFNGIEGLINDRLIDLGRSVCTKDDFDLLKQTPSSVLGSCRFKLPDCEVDPEPYDKIIATLKKHDIGAFFYIGGNDSMDTVVKLSYCFARRGVDISVIGVPKTIDNDLFETDHTPGFGSAAKYVVSSVNEIIRDSSVYDLRSVTIVEVMGRHAGWLTASTCLLRLNGEIQPQLIYLPERSFSPEKFIDDVRRELRKNNTVVVAVSEGIRIESASGDSSPAARPDGFGHICLGGVGKQLEELVRKEIGCKVRSVELNVLQRCASHFASKTDIFEAENAGRVAVRLMLSGETGIMVRIRRISDSPYRIAMEGVDASAVANKDKPFPQKWINELGNNVTDDAIPYFLPLIQGELQIKTENGIPMHFKF